MEFETHHLRLAGSDQRVEVATRVEFEDIAELAFAIGCVDAFTLCLELDPPAGFDPDKIQGVIDSTKYVSARLGSLLSAATNFNQALLAQSMTATGRFVSEDQETADFVQQCVDDVRNNPRVRRHFPRDRTDLLTLFGIEH